jgi:heme-degrading monooxygenase HmoA
MPTGFAATPEPPYLAVIFTARRTPEDAEGYGEMAAAMFARAMEHPGCLGAESARSPDGLGITVAYFTDEESVGSWKADAEHLVAQRLGKERWYDHYELRVARVERAYSGPGGR